MSLERSRSGSVISARTALEGRGDAVNAADSSGPDGSTCAISFRTAGPDWRSVSKVERGSKNPVLSHLLQGCCLVVVRRWSRMISHSLGLLELEVTDPYL